MKSPVCQPGWFWRSEDPSITLAEVVNRESCRFESVSLMNLASAIGAYDGNTVGVELSETTIKTHLGAVVSV